MPLAYKKPVYYKESLEPKVALLRFSVNEKNLITTKSIPFDYFSQNFNSQVWIKNNLSKMNRMQIKTRNKGEMKTESREEMPPQVKKENEGELEKEGQVQGAIC